MIYAFDQSVQKINNVHVKCHAPCSLVQLQHAGRVSHNRVFMDPTGFLSVERDLNTLEQQGQERQAQRYNWKFIVVKG